MLKLDRYSRYNTSTCGSYITCITARRSCLEFRRRVREMNLSRYRLLPRVRIISGGDRQLKVSLDKRWKVAHNNILRVASHFLLKLCGHARACGRYKRGDFSMYIPRPIYDMYRLHENASNKENDIQPWSLAASINRKNLYFVDRAGRVTKTVYNVPQKRVLRPRRALCKLRCICRACPKKCKFHQNEIIYLAQ